MPGQLAYFDGSTTPERPPACSRASPVRPCTCCSVPGANDHRGAQTRGLRGPKDWCTHVFLEADLQIVYVAMRGSVYGFSVQNGQRVYDWEDIHEVSQFLNNFMHQRMVDLLIKLI